MKLLNQENNPKTKNLSEKYFIKFIISLSLRICFGIFLCHKNAPVRILSQNSENVQNFIDSNEKREHVLC